MEFEVEGSIYFSKDEGNFCSRPRGRYINFVPLWIKMLCDKGIM